MLLIFCIFCVHLKSLGSQPNKQLRVVFDSLIDNKKCYYLQPSKKPADCREEMRCKPSNFHPPHFLCEQPALSVLALSMSVGSFKLSEQMISAVRLPQETFCYSFTYV